MTRWWSLTALAALALLSTPAAAQERTVVEAGQLSGELSYGDVEIRGQVTVSQFSLDEADTGYLHIRASTITISELGGINANGAGFQGSAEPSATLNGAGAGDSPPDDMATALPGGGAGHFAAGGPGYDATCTVFPGVNGGTATGNGAATLLIVGMNDEFTSLRLGMGSAGGSSWTGPFNMNARRPGSAGGGVVVLEAAVIQLDGSVTANGETLGTSLLGAGPGGGAGGTVVLAAQSITVGSNARIEARGANGGVQTNNPQTFGGNGAGGVVALFTDEDLAMFLQNQVDVSGGTIEAAESCMGNDPAPGADGEKAVLGPRDCIDADGDGAPNLLCGGTDCDDDDPAIFPNADEVCNGADDNCDGSIDEEADAPLCSLGTGAVCMNGSCVGGSGGGGNGPPPAVEPPTVELLGGLCATRAPGHPSPAGAWWLAVLGLAVAGARRWSGGR